MRESFLNKSLTYTTKESKMPLVLPKIKTPMKEECGALPTKNFSKIQSDKKFFDFISVAKIAGEKEEELTPEKVLFCYRVVLRTIDACLKGRYTDFDGHTTANCCHGMSLLVRELITKIHDIDLQSLQIEGEERVERLGKSQEETHWSVPSPLIDLANIYIIAFAKEVDPLKGDRTSKRKLKTIAPIGKSFCFSVIGEVQKRYSQLVAESYHKYFSDMDRKFEIAGAPIELWGKYVAPNYIRIDKCGVHYAPALYSMQICLAQLILSKAKIACIIDLLNEKGELKGRHIVLFQGDGKKEFVLINSQTFEELYSYQKEPIIVFGGCVYSDHIEIEELKLKVKPWLKQFSHLILACDIFYPQFPHLKEDPEFNLPPINPEEEHLQKILATFSDIKGVTVQDSSLFCLTHVYSASVHQILKVITGQDNDALSLNMIPLRLRSTS